jgi:predicted transposase YbfD/YdcC
MTRYRKDQTFIDLTQEIDLVKLQASLQTSLANFPDPRLAERSLYPSWYLILIIFTGYLANCDTVADIAWFAEIRQEWFVQLLGFEAPAPSYNTIWWFLVRVKPQAFKALMANWLKNIDPETLKKLMVVDGKRLKGVSNNEHVVHLVELFSAERGLTLALEKVPSKTDERAALPHLLESIDIQGALISMDALFAHVSDTKEVLKRGGDYLVAIKANQPKLHAEAENYFEQAHDINYEDVPVTLASSEEKGHGRIEKRKVCATHDLSWLPHRDDWQLQTLIEVRTEQTIGSEVKTSIRYYGSSRKAKAAEFLIWIRQHWLIESLHYVMDVTFDEDANLASSGYMAENMAIMRRFAANVIKTYDPNRGMASARRGSTHEPNYLRGLLGRLFC